VGNSAQSICALAFGVLNFATLAAFESIVFVGSLAGPELAVLEKEGQSAAEFAATQY
jgi:hypothetical protein